MISCCIVPRTRTVSDQSCRENEHVHFMFNNPPPKKKKNSFLLWDNVEKYGRGRQSTVDIIRRLRIARRTTNTKIQTHTHTHTLIIFNTYCFPTVTMVMRTRLNVTLYVHCLVLLTNTLRDGTDDRSACWIESTCAGDTRGLSWPHAEVKNKRS